MCAWIPQDIPAGVSEAAHIYGGKQKQCMSADLCAAFGLADDNRASDLTKEVHSNYYPRTTMQLSSSQNPNDRRECDKVS